MGNLGNLMGNLGSPIPIRTPLLDADGSMTKPWVNYFESLAGGVNVETPRRLINGARVPDAQTSFYTSPRLARTTITKLTFTNTTGDDVVVKVHLAPAGDSAVSANLVLEQAVLANSTLDATAVEGHVLEEGGQIFAAAATPNALTILGSGILTT